MANDSFELYDLRVEVVPGDKPYVCSHHTGQGFNVEGENLIFPEGGRFSLYSMAALLPLLPAKQRMTHAHDWMTTDSLIACPDPYCGALFKITRTGIRSFNHSDCTVVPLNPEEN